MTGCNWRRAVGVGLLWCAPWGWAQTWEQTRFYTGVCDASAGVMLSGGYWLMASDEDDVLRVYAADGGERPVSVWDMSGHLGSDPGDSEADLEAATRVGLVAYWLGSHEEDGDGKRRKRREVLFATLLDGGGAAVTVRLWGRVYRQLRDDVRTDGRVDAEALNLEGMAATERGGLWLGCRSPVGAAGTSVIEVLNPEAMLREGDRARLGRVVGLDLGGLGIWDMVRGAEGYYLVAGPSQGRRPCRLMHWDGGESGRARIVGDLDWEGFQPEVLLWDPQGAGGGGWVLSDDGGVEVDGVRCKELDLEAREYRGARLRW